MEAKRHPENVGMAQTQGGAESSHAAQVDRFAKWVRNLSLLSLGTIALATVILWAIAERTWWGTVFIFCPHCPFLVPPAILLLVSAFAHRRSFMVNLACLALVAGPLMGGRLPFTMPSLQQEEHGELTIVSCNVQAYQPDFESLLKEIVARRPDVVAFQEAPYEHEMCKRYFPGWHTIQEPNFWIGSRYPFQKVDADRMPRRFYDTVLSVRIDTPEGPVILHDVHLMTPRHGLAELSIESILNGKGPASLANSTRLRMDESREARRYIARNQPALPTLIVGDFNMPTISNLYRDNWQDFTNAFDEAGGGFGYTAPCSTHRYWFNNVPWVRIDHILADRAWKVRACEIGRGRGSDHRLIWARVARR
jgi:endonuclease/exonuclease/phosphatase (EEP) superfamily protein YafD